ncbi:MAG: LysR family transcriptional regulator [Alistipes sp.]|jgi:LysR family hydrogen peroxide-inducible transcriptional activator|nr:LysR family transcriptional regulator [Alistipes sp.]
MTLQQLEYIVAVDKYRHFVRAAESCGVTQSTLSSLIQKLEAELDATIFDRTQHPVAPTPLGEEIIAQARVILYNASQMGELVASYKGSAVGDIRLGTVSTIAPFILPQLFRYMSDHHGDINLHVEEARVETIKQKLKRAELDIAILAMPVADEALLEIPIYHERYYAYVSPEDTLYNKESLPTNELTAENIWMLGESYCPNTGQFPFCISDMSNASIYVAGSIDTLMRIVDDNGGYTIIPEMQLPLISPERKAHIREIVDPTPGREIAFVVRKDFVKERMINILADALKSILPDAMLNERLKKFRIKL